MEDYKKTLDEGRQLVGVVVASKFSEVLGQDVLVIKDDDHEVIMPREEIDVIFERSDLSTYVGKKMKFKVMKIMENG